MSVTSRNREKPQETIERESLNLWVHGSSPWRVTIHHRYSQALAGSVVHAGAHQHSRVYHWCTAEIHSTVPHSGDAFTSSRSSSEPLGVASMARPPETDRACDRD